MTDPRDPVALTQALVRCASVTPNAGEALDLLQGLLEPLGFVCHRLRFEGDGSYPVDNLFAKRGQGAPHLAFAGHVDVVPPGERDRWQLDPFAGEIRDGRLYGRGAADMKSGVAAFVAAAAKLVLASDAPGGSISLLITGDEEGDAVNGTAKLIAWATERGERFDGCIVGEPTCPERLGDVAKIGRRGSLTGQLVVRGRQGHTAYPQRADNAAHRLIAVLDRLVRTPLDEGTSWFQPSNLQVTSIDIGNPAGNVIPGEATARFNIRFNDRHTRSSLERWLHEQIAPLVPDYTLAVSGNAEAFVTEPGRLTEILAASVEAETGTRPRLDTAGGTSDARFIQRYCPVIEFGLVGTTMHQANEHVAVADIEGLTRIYERFLRQFLASA
ncbi:succinyl-diaminopimelate desuccinylase [Benzoatithermus flavus]|uniref:Succinyl-diaminopimelate desuccinylase n=1 Tax=Benzoatithermus flavus TaxID=3108223 RepID=A0ABU8XQ08_9PROT